VTTSSIALAFEKLAKILAKRVCRKVTGHGTT
jgi:hypothetical protein